jgi:heme A synthase
MVAAAPLKRFSRFTIAVLAWILLTVLWGAYVRASGSGAGCGSHWPLCNGQVIPRPEQIETVIEFTHRLLSAGALILIGAMVIWGFRVHPKDSPVRMGLVASGILIVTEALLGASLVLFGWVTSNPSAARAAAMSLHLVNTFLLVASLALTAWWAAGGGAVHFNRHSRLPWLLLVGLLGVLLVGMSGAITALGDTIFPSGSLAEGLAQDLDPDAHFLVRLRSLHPLIAVTVGLYLIFLAIYARDLTSEQDTSRLGNLLIVLVGAQWCLGLLNLLLLVPIWTQLTHLFIADMLWITLVLFSVSALGRAGTETLPRTPLAAAEET